MPSLEYIVFSSQWDILSKLTNIPFGLVNKLLTTPKNRKTELTRKCCFGICLQNEFLHQDKPGKLEVGPRFKQSKLIISKDAAM